MDLGDDLRRGEVEEIGIPLDVVCVVAEALASVLLLGEAAAMDEDSPRPVEHQDSVREKLAHTRLDVHAVRVVEPLHRRSRAPPGERLIDGDASIRYRRGLTGEPWVPP